MGKIMSFKEWLMADYGLDYDRWEPELTDVTRLAWHGRYNEYLQDWEGREDEKRTKIARYYE